MRPRRETKPGPPFSLDSVDRFGKQIAPAVMSVSMEIGPRALAYAQNLIGDPALAINYFEEAAASVSAAMEEKEGFWRTRCTERRGIFVPHVHPHGG
jgi:hypothetical protein